MSKEDKSDKATRLKAGTERAAVIREFMALDDRTTEIADSYAARIGVRRSQFYRLVQTFGETRDQLTEVHGSIGQARLDKRVERKIEAVLDRLGPACRLSDVRLLVADACTRTGLRVPTDYALRTRMLSRKRSGEGTSGPAVQIDQTGLGMAVIIGDQEIIPTLTLAIHMPTGRILAHQLDAPPSSDARADLELVVASTFPTFQAGDRPLRKGEAALLTFGERLGRLLLRANWAGKPASARYKFRVGLDEARSAVATLIDRHNSNRPQSDDL